MRLKLRIWRQKNTEASGGMVNYDLDDITPDMSFLEMLDTLNEKLRPKLLAELKPGTRIVSHAFRMGDWQPEKTETVEGRTIYFWTVPNR